MTTFKKLAAIRSNAEMRDYLREIGADFDLFDHPPAEQFARPFTYTETFGGKTRRFSNRWAIHPMEGWDGQLNGDPSDLTRRRWEKFADSGAKMIFGGEATAVEHTGRSNTRQIMITAENIGKFSALREALLKRHRERFGAGDEPVIGLQLTHSGRFSKPNDDTRPEPKTAYEHPYLDQKFRCGAANVLTDDDLKRTIDRFIDAASYAQKAGFDFVDVKCAHGYLAHELLTAHTRPGPFGGSLENRTRFFREIVEGIRSRVPGLEVAVRFSVGDMIPFVKGPDGVGRPISWEGTYPFAFGADETGFGWDEREPAAFVQMAWDLGIRLIDATFGSPYYVPHTQRPAAFAVSDGYLPPEDPLLGVARQIRIVRRLKELFPKMTFIGSGYSYLQEYLPAVGAEVLRTGAADFIGIGRGVLCYPEMCADTLARRPLDKRRICRTFGDCTNAPRIRLISGCYPLDPFYRARPEAEVLKASKGRKQ